MLALVQSYELDLRADEIDVGGEKPQSRHGSGMDGFPSSLASQEHVINGGVEAGLLDSQSRGRIALWIEVDDKGGAGSEGKTGGEVYSGRRLPDSALLVYDRYDFTHEIPGASRSNVPRPTLYPRLMLSLTCLFHGQHSP